MAGTLIIGYGNPLRADDGLGWRVAELLGGLPGAQVRAVHQLTPELAEDMSRAALVIFVDAAEGGPAGEWECREVTPSPEGRPFTHHVDPGALAAAAGALYGHAPRALLFTMFGESFELREGLSAKVARALPGLVDAVRVTASRERR